VVILFTTVPKGDRYEGHRRYDGVPMVQRLRKNNRSEKLQYGLIWHPTFGRYTPAHISNFFTTNPKPKVVTKHHLVISLQPCAINPQLIQDYNLIRTFVQPYIMLGHINSLRVGYFIYNRAQRNASSTAGCKLTTIVYPPRKKVVNLRISLCIVTT
jgi:hypothetical protein